MSKQNKIEFEAKGAHVTDVNSPDQVKHIKDIKTPRKQLRHSPFHLIVNTNKRYNAGSHQLEEECTKLQKVTAAIINDLDQLKNFIQFKEPGHSWTDEYIKKVVTAAGVER